MRMLFGKLLGIFLPYSVQKKSLPAPVKKELKFSSSEIKEIRTVWKKAKDREATLELLIEVIKKKPSFALLFGVKLETETDLRNCPSIVAHAAKITNFIDTLVSGLAELTIDEIRRIVYKVGVIHFRRHVNFDAENWLLFKNILMEKICFNVNEHTRMAWFKLLHLMVLSMKDGFLAEALKSGSQILSEKHLCN